MEIEQVKRARREMEDLIRVAVMEAIDTFNTKTGMYPERLDVGLVEAATICEHDRPFIVGVHAEVTI